MTADPEFTPESSDASFASQTFRYWEVFLSWLFKYPSRCYRLSDNIKPFKLENACPKLNQFGQSYRARAASKGVICHVTSSQEDIETTRQVLKLIYTEIHDPKQCDFLVAEVLAKVLAYRELKEGDSVLIPTLDEKHHIHLSKYTVDKVIDLWNKTCAFALISSDNHVGCPLLLFRGTDFSIIREGGRASIISDLDPTGPGHTLFKQSERKIQNWLKVITKQYGKARVIGHSLGGAIAAYALLYLTPYISKKAYEISYAFNPPGITADLVKKWNQIPEKERPSYRAFVCRGDLISKFGHLFGTVTEISLENTLSPIRAHELLLFAEPLCFLHAIDIERENACPSRQFYSRLQQQTSSVIYEFGLKFLFPP